jgi:8-oxo-dGTP diphosphatase
LEVEFGGGIVSIEKMGRRNIRVVAAVVEKNGRYLITQRRPTAVLPLLWEFPGGRVEDNEGDAEALRREIRERLDVDVDVGTMISFISHPYEKYTVDLYLYECKLQSERLEAKGVNAFRWIPSGEFERYPFTPADQASMDRLLGEPEDLETP